MLMTHAITNKGSSTKNLNITKQVKHDTSMNVLPCEILFLCFSVLLALRLPRLGKRELILVLLVRLFDLCLFGCVGFLFLLVSGKGCGL